MSDDGEFYRNLYMNFVRAFDGNQTASQFLRDDGDGGFAAGISRMAAEIDRLRLKCGEPPRREPGWEDAEDAIIDRFVMAKIGH